MGIHHRAEPLIHDDDVRRLDGYVGTGANRNPDVGLGEGGGIVDPVANHHHPNPTTLKLADFGGFLVGQHFGVDFLDANLGGDHCRGAMVVACDHHRSDPGLLDAPDSLGCVVFDGIGDADEPEKLAVASHRDDSLAFVLESFSVHLQRGEVDTLFGEPVRLPDQDSDPFDGGLDTSSSMRLEGFGVDQ